VQIKIIFLAILVCFGCACSSRNNHDEKQPASVFVKKVQLEQISDILNYPARINAKVNATVLSESQGIVSDVLVTLGQSVKAQQILMILKHTDPIYQFAPLQVRAPIAGIVSSIEVTQGSHVTDGQLLAAVINPSQIELQTEIPAQDLSVMKKGVLGEFKLPGQEKALQVEVIGVSPFVKPTTGTASAKLKIVSGVNQILSPGMQGQVSFKTHLHSGFLIPDSAIVYKGKETFVKVVEGKKIKQIAVELGAKQRGLVEIPKGLTVDLELVERSSRSVGEGETVTVEPSSPTSGKL
jgi:multidrug efflux pump subunit AcrA (membrane-fusion protein)